MWGALAEWVSKRAKSPFQGMNGPNELFYQKAKRLLHKKYSSLRLGFFQCHGTQFPKFKIAEKKIDNLGTVYFPTAL